MTKKIATVVAATGSQGNAAINALLAKPDYKIRALTRRPDAEAAKALKAKGIEIVQADVNDEASLKSAFAGSHLIFAVTNFFEPFAAHGPEKAISIEKQQGINIARAAQATSTLEHFIWSTLPRALDISGGKLSVPHFDGKNQVDKFIRSDAALLAKTTFLFVGWYDTNFQFPMFTPTLVPTADKYVVVGDYPADTPVGTIGDISKNLPLFIKAIIEHPEKTKNGEIVFASVDVLQFEKLLQKWAGIHGKEAVYIKTDTATYYRLWPMWAEEMGSMMRFFDVHRGKEWSDPDREVLNAGALKIDPRGFVPLDESFKALTY